MASAKDLRELRRILRSALVTATDQQTREAIERWLRELELRAGHAEASPVPSPSQEGIV